MPFSSATGSYSSATPRATSAASNSLIAVWICAGFGPGDHQERVEGRDQPVGFLDRLLQRKAIGVLASRRAQRLLGAVAQPRQWRLEVVGDVVGHFLQAGHQLLDAIEHGIGGRCEPVDLVGAAGDPEPAREVAVDDRPAGIVDVVEAMEDAPGDEPAAGDAEDDDQRGRPQGRRQHGRADEALLLEVEADQQAESARQVEDAHQRHALLAAFLVAGIGNFGPAGLVEDLGGQLGDVAGERIRRPNW